MKPKNPLKYITTTISLFAVLIVCSVAATPEEESRFIANVKTAFDTKDANKLLALVCWDGVTPYIKQMFTPQMSQLVQKSPAKIELVAPDPKENFEYTRGGVTYRPNLTIVKQLKITFNVENPAADSAAYQVGEKAGTLLITTAAPAK